MSVINTPTEVINSYYDQKKIIKKMIESLGIKFFSSLQPFLHSKKSLSQYEKNYLQKSAKYIFYSLIIGSGIGKTYIFEFYLCCFNF